MASASVRTSRPREMSGKSYPKRTMSSPPRFSRSRALISRTLWNRWRQYLPDDPEGRRRLEDYLLYAGVVLVVVIATYLVVFD